MVASRAKVLLSTSVVDPPNRDIERTGSIVHCNESVVDPHESDFARSARCVVGNGRDLNGIESIAEETFHVTGDVADTIFQLCTLARKNCTQHYQPGRKSIFTPATLLENPESDKCDETHILEHDKIQLLDSLHILQGRLKNREIAFNLAIRAITGSSTHILSTISSFVPAPTSAFRSPAALPICCVERSPNISLISRFLMNSLNPQTPEHQHTMNSL